MSETEDFYTKYRKMLKGEIPWDGEYDETVVILEAFNKLPKEEQDRIVEEYNAKQQNNEQTLDK